jgi:hypothetical protein
LHFSAEGGEVTRTVNAVCFILLLVCSCDGNPVASRNSLTFFPLAIGNEWGFEYPYWTPSSGDTTLQVNYRIVVAKMVQGIKYYTFDNHLPFFPYHHSLKQLIGGHLDSIFVRQNEIGDVMLLVDDSEWQYISFDASLLGSMVKTRIRDADYYFRIESTNDTVSTPIGVFHDCCRVLNYFPAIKGTEHYIWFAPGYGPVKIYYPELDVTYQLVRIIVQQNS